MGHLRRISDYSQLGKPTPHAVAISQRESVGWVPYLLFFVWPAALCPKAVQLVLYVLVLVGLIVELGASRISKLHIGRVECFLLCFCAVYMIAILVHVPQSESSRIIAAGNTLACWVISILTYTMMRQSELDRSRISKIALANVVILVALSLIYFAGIKMSLSFGARQLAGVDWINGKRTLRLHAFLEYSTLVAAMYFLFFPLSLCCVCRWKHRLLSYFYCVLAIVPVIACSSRTGILLGVLATIAGIFYINEKTRVKAFSRGAKVVIVAVIAIVLIVIFHSELLSAIQELLDSRQGSTDTRRSLYQYTFNEVVTQSPIIGCGIKDTVAQFGEAVPVGSHSTYLGVFYRTGIVGSFLFIAGLICLVQAVIRGGSSSVECEYRFFYTLLFLAFFVTEDIDGADWLLVSSFSVAGFLAALRSICEERAEKRPCSSSHLNIQRRWIA